MIWQFDLINELALKYGAIENGLSNVPIDASLDAKRRNLIFTLKKFYAPTIENLSDVSNRLVWLADPSMFNDPHDCELSIGDDFDLYVLEKMAQDESLFTEDEWSIIYKARKRHRSITSPDVFKIINLNNRWESFENMRNTLKREIDRYLSFLKSSKYRIACFVQDWGNPYEYDDLMWAHYAQSHKGFCVEYDVEGIFDPSKFREYSVFYMDHLNNFYNGLLSIKQQQQILTNGFFPVVYSSKRQIIPSGYAYRIGIGCNSSRIKNDVEIKFLRSLLTKNLIWKYEREWRLIVCDELVKNLNYKIPFPFAKAIIPGHSASRELKLLLKEIADKLKIKYWGTI